VDLPAGEYAVEWFSLAGRAWTAAEDVTVGDAGATQFEPPSAVGSWVLHLSRGR
jgi:hypothetical protein